MKSDAEDVTCGVPQGSILGPLFFTIYINDLPKISSFQTRLFADDACLIYSSKYSSEIQNNVNTELEKVNDWLKANLLSVNYSKSNYIIFTKKRIQKDLNIIMDGNKLERISEIKYLGVILDEKLNWKSHIELIKSKISRGSYIIAKLRHYVPLYILKMVYYAIIHPHLNYCLTTWGGASKSNLLPLCRLQKKIIRIMTFSSYTAHASPIFHKLKILPLDYIYKFNLGLTFYKISNNIITTGTHHLTSLNKIHSHNTRLSQNNNFFQTFNRVGTGQATYSSKGLKFWRELPPELKILSLQPFKYKLKKYLFKLLENSFNNNA